MLYEETQLSVDWINGIVQRNAIVEKIDDPNSSGLKVRVISAIYTSNAPEEAGPITSSESYYAGSTLGGCNGYTAPNSIKNAADRLKLYKNMPWVVSACVNGGTLVYIPGGVSISSFSLPSYIDPACVTNNYFQGSDATCLNFATMTSYGNLLDNLDDCIESDVRTQFSNNNFNFLQTDWHCHISSGSQGYHGGNLAYARVVCTSSGKGQGY